MIKNENDWLDKERVLSLDEEELLWKQQQLRRQKKSRRLEEELEAEERFLRKERRIMDQEKKEIQSRREALERDRDEASSTPLFRDSTTRIDLFWWLDHNEEQEWALECLQSLQKLDPHNVRRPVQSNMVRG
ncbi:hypothetical protein INS49_005230 [Diaporthe citri]|uniref:uncharacterized protein n=1 Tax=Diaporthe citri TaxID=83186 RepID=UPI001C811315|nr:uncharacterized protein INS49_005230 [Diaporthe citri]KAG6353754.1 hypothetical protein INS49_005230 [Diaporthe citri]